MKKFMMIAVCVLMSITASAVEFTFAPVDKVAQSGNGFFAYSGDEAVAISALQYMQMRNATGYYILSVDGQKTVAAGDEFSVEKLVADSVGLDGTQPKVFFTNGTTKTFSKSEWLKVLKGQSIRRIYFDTPTWEFENFSTMEGEFALHSKTTPTKLETPKAPTKLEAKASDTKSDSLPTKVEKKTETKKTEAQGTSGNNGGISFRITH